MYPPMEDLLNLLNSPSLADRKKAIDALQGWNEQLVMEDAIALLEEAGKIWPLSNEEWDDPSLALVRAACVFIHEDMVGALEKNMFRFSYNAINFALSVLVILGTEEAKQLYKNTFRELYFQAPMIPLNKELYVIFEQKERTLTAMEVLIENELFLHPWYDAYYHYLAAVAVEKKYITSTEVPLNQEFIRDQLQQFMDQYLEYHPEYTRAFVYEAWKSPYYDLRFFLKIYLSLYNSFSSEEELLNLQTILKWKDPEIKLYYIELLWKRNIHHDDSIQTVQDILISNDGTHQAYHLLETYKPELLPKDPSFQSYFVKEEAENLFYNSSGIEKFPTEVEIMGSFQEKDVIYEGDLTYYVLRFRSTDPSFAQKGWMRMLIGAYYTLNLPRPWHPHELDDGNTDFLPWNSKSYEEHVVDFRAHLAEKHGTGEKEEVFYQSRPSYKRVNNTIALLAFIGFFALIWVNDWFLFGLLIPPIWLLLKYLHDKRLEKNVLVQIRGYSLDYFCFNEGTYIPLNEISKIHYEKRKIAKRERFLSLPIKTGHYIIYDHGGQEIYIIPDKYLIEEYFIPILKSRMNHLSQPAVITWEEKEGA
ncbi:hypothetical protein ACWM35_12585 [Neobacillus sp. K501]